MHLKPTTRWTQPRFLHTPYSVLDSIVENPHRPTHLYYCKGVQPIILPSPAKTDLVPGNSPEPHQSQPTYTRRTPTSSLHPCLPFFSFFTSAIGFLACSRSPMAVSPALSRCDGSERPCSGVGNVCYLKDLDASQVLGPAPRVRADMASYFDQCRAALTLLSSTC